MLYKKLFIVNNRIKKTLMTIPSRSKNRTQILSRLHRQDKRRYWKQIPIFTILVTLGLGLLFFYQSTFVVSDNPHAEIISQSEQTVENPTLKESKEEIDNSKLGEDANIIPHNKPVASSKLALESDREPSNSKVGRPLSEEERQHIIQILGQQSWATSIPTFEQIPKFILHDTSGDLSDAGIQSLAGKARGPLGNGIAAYVARSGKVTIARPIFFNQRRPTATVYEKSVDILSESIRNQEARRVWQATATPSRQAALKNAVVGLQIDETSLMQRAIAWLNSPSEQAFETLKARSSTNLDGGKTTGLWTIAQICDRVLMDSKNVANIASSSPTEKTLKSACQRINPVLSENRKRVASSTHVEIIQNRGSECYTSDAQVKAYNATVPDNSKIQGDSIIPLQTWERPAYTDQQYGQIASLYLQAVLQANQFPQITTHYWVDRGEFGNIGTHCDPRGFDLMRLYQTISLALGHPSDTLYGIEPRYGLHPEKGDNVWWVDAVFGELPPSNL